MPWLVHQLTTLMPAGRLWQALICAAHSRRRHYLAAKVVSEFIDLPLYSGIKSWNLTFDTHNRNIVYCLMFLYISRGMDYLPFTVIENCFFEQDSFESAFYFGVDGENV